MANTEEVSSSKSELSPERSEVSENKPEDKSSKEKGNEFEGYIADILRQNGITIKEWNQGSISPSGAMAENALNPDFFVSQTVKDFPIEYWVESKWRKE